MHPLPQGWARRDVRNSSGSFTNFSKRPKCEQVDGSNDKIERTSNSILLSQLDAGDLESLKFQEHARPYRRRRRVDDAFDTILRHVSFGEKSTHAGESSQMDRSYRPWRSTRSLQNADFSADKPRNSRTDFVQYSDEFPDQISKGLYDEEGEFSHPYRRSPSLFEFKGCQHVPFQRWEPNSDLRCDSRTNPAFCLPTYPSENETRLSTSSWIHADSYANDTQYPTYVLPDSTSTDQKHFLGQSQTVNGNENKLFCEENMNVSRIRSCRSPIENRFFRMQPNSLPNVEYHNCARCLHFPLASHYCGDAEALSAVSSRPKPMFSRTLPANYYLPDYQGQENRLRQSSQSCRRFSGCPSTIRATENTRQVNPGRMQESNFESIREQERDCQSDWPVSTDSLLEVFTEDWILPLAPKHSTPKREPFQSTEPYKRIQSSSNSALSTSNYQPTKELQNECWDDMQSASSQKTPVFELGNNNDKAIQVSFEKSTSNAEVQALFPTSLTTACPRCGYLPTVKRASQAALSFRIPMTKLNSSLKTLHTVPPPEQTINLHNETDSSTNTCISVDLPDPANLSDERTPKQCIIQEGYTTTHSASNVYSRSRPLHSAYSKSNQYAASAKIKGPVKLADISSPSYDFGLEE